MILDTIWQVAVVVLTWVVCVALQWGIFREKIRVLEVRVGKLEDERFLTREEYHQGYNMLQDQIGEIRRTVYHHPGKGDQ